LIPDTICVSPVTFFAIRSKAMGDFQMTALFFILHSKILPKQKLHVM